MAATGPVSTEEVSCDLCGSSSGSVVYELHDTLYGLPGRFVLRRCDHCKLMYLSPRPSQESVALYYPPAYECYAEPIEQERCALMRWMRRTKLVKRRRLVEQQCHVAGGRILDVGCATGLFLHEMAISGWEAIGVEPNAHAAEAARRSFNLEIFAGRLRDVSWPAGSFDAITFWDVLEHTASPSEDLAQAYKLLRPGGVLLISIPNWEGIDRRLFGIHWNGFDCPRHTYVFPPRVLDEFLRRSGFSPMRRVCPASGYYAVLPSIKRLLDASNAPLSQILMGFLRLPGVRILFEPLFFLWNSMNLGPIMMAVAVKEPSSHPGGPDSA